MKFSHAFICLASGKTEYDILQPVGRMELDAGDRFQRPLWEYSGELWLLLLLFYCASSLLYSYL